MSFVLRYLWTKQNVQWNETQKNASGLPTTMSYGAAVAACTIVVVACCRFWPIFVFVYLCLCAGDIILWGLGHKITVSLVHILDICNECTAYSAFIYLLTLRTYFLGNVILGYRIILHLFFQFAVCVEVGGFKGSLAMYVTIFGIL